eukprot:TRINITY_DN4963_c0_g2_i3.p1 TRINITY_DN4963_c0_g2~~TRINITY_DN4963_c0_g2_i3.p1  ORF type:complete len:472 (-),score=85.03 TRINITY_DN4963_c0_g2_i3:198-1613(-)
MARDSSDDLIDSFVVGFASFTGFLILVSALYIVRHRRKWLPFRCKSLHLFLLGVFGGLVWLASIQVANQHYGSMDLTDDECIFWIYGGQLVLGQNLYVYAMVIRLYRLYFILVRHKDIPHMAFTNVGFMLLPSLLAAIFAFIYHGSEYSEDMCRVEDPLWLTILGFLFMLPIVLLLGLSWLTRSIRTEFNEHKVTLTGAIFSLLTSVFIATIVLLNMRENVYGRMMITLMVVLNVNYYYWFTIGGSLFSYMTNNVEYLERYRNLIRRSNPFFFGSHLYDLLKDDEWRQNFKDYASKKYCLENVEFWEALLIREELISRQSDTVVSHTKHIIETYIVAGSAHELNISSDVRNQILSVKNLTDPDIFLRAREQVYHLLNTNLFRQFITEKSYERWREEEQRTRRENDLLRQYGILEDDWLDAEALLSVYSSRGSRGSIYMSSGRLLFSPDAFSSDREVLASGDSETIAQHDMA